MYIIQCFENQANKVDRKIMSSLKNKMAHLSNDNSVAKQKKTGVK